MSDQDETPQSQGSGALTSPDLSRAGAPGGFALFDGAPTASFVLGADGRIQEVNRLGSALLGLSHDDLLGRSLGGFMAPLSRSAFDALLRRVFDAPVRQSAEVAVLSAEGTSLDLLLGAVMLEGGAPGRCLLTATDVTPYKEAQRLLQRGNVDLSEQLRERTARARALNEELEQVVRTFTRQLQRPTGQAMNVLGLLRRALGEPADGVARSLLHIERALQQIVALFESVDRYMRARALRVHLRPVDLNAVLREVLKDVRPLPVVQGDSQVLFLIFNEYISNALKFTRTREEARIHIVVQDAGPSYHVGVRDNGVGFDPRGQDRLFQLFGRQHPSSAYEGSGLGLAVVRRSCERFGGRAWGEGQPGEGATFWFAWPKRPVVLE